jgi:hypothetical protein
VKGIRSDKLFDQRCELSARVVRLSETDADKGEIDDGIYCGEDGIGVGCSEPEVAAGTAVLVVLNLGWGQTQRSSVTLWAQQALGGSLYNKHNRIKRNFVALVVVGEELCIAELGHAHASSFHSANRSQIAFLDHVNKIGCKRGDRERGACVGNNGNLLPYFGVSLSKTRGSIVPTADKERFAMLQEAADGIRYCCWQREWTHKA